jgi:hypothetical protein
MNKKQMQECIQICWECRDTCQDVLFNHCLEEQGDHTEAKHVKIMADCIQACQVAADFMRRNSELHESECHACAEVCEACAESCEEFEDDEEMMRCAEICRQCADSCYEMTKTIRKAA